MKIMLDQIIDESGLKRGFIAKKIKVNTNQLKNYCIGKSFPPGLKLLELCLILGKKPEEIYVLEEGENYSDYF